MKTLEQTMKIMRLTHIIFKAANLDIFISFCRTLKTLSNHIKTNLTIDKIQFVYYIILDHKIMIKRYK